MSPLAAGHRFLSRLKAELLELFLKVADAITGLLTNRLKIFRVPARGRATGS